MRPRFAQRAVVDPRHRRRRLPLALTVALLLVAAAPAATARAGVVDDWNATAVQVAAAPAPDGAGLGPPLAMPHVAVASLAIYDTVMAFDGRYEPYQSTVDVPRGASFTAAVATAAHDALVGRLPALAPLLDARYADSLAAVRDGRAKQDGIAVGHQVAAALLAARASDGYGIDRPEYYVAPPAAAGVWAPLAGRGVFPWVGHLTPFVLRAPDQFRPDPPPALTSRRWARDFNEIKALGGAVSTRTAEQTNLALFFTDNATVQWNHLAHDLLDRHGVRAGDRARLYAQLATAGADALIGCWEAKYHYLFWRPEAAITTTFDDGNPETTPDPAWRPLRPTPNFADYTSGHSCVTTASMTVLQQFFGTDRMTFAVSSHPPGESPATGLIDDTIVFHGFSDVIDAMGDARVWLGYHYRFAVEEGSTLGLRTALWVLCHEFAPVRHRPHGTHGH